MVRLSIIHPDSNLELAYKLIHKFKKKNRLRFNLIVGINDQLIEENTKFPICGNYTPGTNVIEINPQSCRELERLEKYSFPGYIEDNSCLGTTIHEFSHFLSLNLFPKMVRDYKTTFPESRLLLTSYEEANVDIDEEIAEVISCYLLNPYFLRLISSKHYEWCKEWFKSPTPCSAKEFIENYVRFPPRIKRQLKKKWGVVVNFAKNTVYIKNPKKIKESCSVP